MGPRIRGAVSGLAPATVIEPRRVQSKTIVIGTAIGILAYAAIVATVPNFLGGNEPRPPWWAQRAVMLFILLSMPGALGTIGVVRRSPSTIGAAAIVCLCQSFVAFSGVTMGFVIPAILLFAGATRLQAERPLHVEASGGAGLTAMILVFAAWTSMIAITEPRCYLIVRDSDRSIRTVEVPATSGNQCCATHTVPGAAAIGGGCSSAELTPHGILISCAFALGAVAIAARR